MRESFRQKQEAAESLHCLEDLRERLQEECRAREQLAVELNKAESKGPAWCGRPRRQEGLQSLERDSVHSQLVDTSVD